MLIHASTEVDFSDTSADHVLLSNTLCCLYCLRLTVTIANSLPFVFTENVYYAYHIVAI